ncbi:hypothetical protein D0T51_10255 [Parabacteroides sp. 52]|uniref:hypothetical protein n=1 Tax=unclassified Parabacteroides TaxID=2649774 RepID=UPI0013D43326|nr:MULTISPECIES: hypothetical protein [unclassified Parabacteroides]MDH6534695.1 hypothetical protein [Parabacteroides sp. PM5-20]NDV56107.1 hypothetical protein [Parabacteroides sp. 52]
MKKTIELVLTILTSSILLCIGVCLIFNREKSLIGEKFQYIFEDTIGIEMEKRVEDSNTFVSFRSQSVQKTDVLEINNEGKVKVLEKDSLYKQLTFEEKRKLFLQTYLKEIEYPIQIITLDSLYTNKLKEESPLIETGVRYIDNENGNITDSKLTNQVYAAYSTTLVELGIEKEMSVQGFYTLPLPYVLWRTRIPVILLLVGWFLVTGLFLFLPLYRRRKMKKNIVYVPVKEMKKGEEDVLLKITDAIYYHPQKAEIHYYQEMILTLSGQAALLFQAFIESSDAFLSYEEIDTLLGWESEDKIRRRRAQAINRLKEMLKPIPEIRIENQNRKGYQLLSY